MPTDLIYKGAKFEVYAWTENDGCPVLEFLENLQKDGNPDGVRLMNLIRRTADLGPLFNIRHCRRLEDDIFEFKAPNTGRIFFFYDRGRMIICTHGVSGKKGSEAAFIRRQIIKAAEIRVRYLSSRWG